jgi:hypothetical protein
MANLSFVEKEKLETLFGMISGYILGFESRSKFQGFMKDIPKSFGLRYIFYFLRDTSRAPHCGEPHIPKQSLVEFQVALI